MTEPTEGERYDAMTQTERTEWLVDGIRKTIEQAGGPDNVRFMSVSTEDIARASCEAEAIGPGLYWFSGTDDDTGLISMNFRTLGAAGAYTIPTLIEVVRQGRGGKVLIDGVKLPWAIGDAGIRTGVVTDGTPSITVDLIASEVRVTDDSLGPDDGPRLEQRKAERQTRGIDQS